MNPCDSCDTALRGIPFFFLTLFHLASSSDSLSQPRLSILCPLRFGSFKRFFSTRQNGLHCDGSGPIIHPFPPPSTHSILIIIVSFSTTRKRLHLMRLRTYDFLYDPYHDLQEGFLCRLTWFEWLSVPSSTALCRRRLSNRVARSS